MTQPSKTDIEEAKKYLRKRLSCELSMIAFLDARLLKAAKEIVSLAYKRNIPPTMFSFEYDIVLSHEVDAIIEKLTEEIREENYTLALSTNKTDKGLILEYITRDINGSSYSDRLKLYTDRFKMELEDFLVGGLMLGYSAYKTMDLIRKSYKDPYNNSVTSEYKRKGFTSYARMSLLVRHTIADAWMYADMEQAIRNGAIGFISYRGSSYPCSLCDDNAGRFHTFAEPYPPYHPHCVCYAVPIYNK